MRPKGTPGREEQRAMILSSAEYLSGESFTRTEAAKLLGLSPESGAHLLSSMAEAGLLIKRLIVKQGSKASGVVQYSKPPSKVARIPWRTKSNLEVGII